MYLLYYGFILSNEKNDGTILTLVNRVVTHVKQFLSMHVFLGSTQCFCLLEKNSEQPFFLIWVSPLSPPNQGRTFLNLRNGVFDFVIERV